MLSQSEVGKLLDQCAQEEDCLLAIEEVLSAYIAWKFIRGQSCELVLQKMRYLAIFLRVTDRRWVLETGKDVFRVLALELTYGGGLIGACPAKTPLGKKVWNDLRRKLGNISCSFSTDPEYGGPIAFHPRRFVDEPSGSSSSRATAGSAASRQNALSSHNNTLLMGPAIDAGTEGHSNATTTIGLHLELSEDTHSNSNHNPENILASGFSSFFHRPARCALQRFQSSSERFRWSERPRWVRMWFLTRPHFAGTSRMMEMLTPEYVSLVPAYTSFQGTLPVYLSERSRVESQ